MLPHGNRPATIADRGPCVLEGFELALEIAEQVKAIGAEFDLPVVFKGSFDKANRTSLSSFRGLGIEPGLDILRQVRKQPA